MSKIGTFFRTRCPALYDLLEPLRVQKYYLSLRLMSPAQVFGKIYRENGWGGTESVSGHGSNLAQTAAIREAIPPLLKELNCRVLLDIPCGDFHWMKKMEMETDYIGCDIVPELIAKNQSLYGRSGCQFLPRNLIADELPQADVLFCRDCLVHLSNAKVQAALQNIKRSGMKYLLTTTYPKTAQNVDIPTGAWRAINLTKPPFNLPEPIRLIDERCVDPPDNVDQHLGLWRMDDVVLKW